MKKYAISFVLLFLFFSFTVDESWTELILNGNSGCSSELQPGDPFEGIQGPYGVHNLFDNDPATAWVEGVKGYGTGEYFIMDLGYALPEKLSIRNGYQKSESVFRKNSRVKSAEITLFVGFHISGEVTEIAEIYKVKKAARGNVVELKDMMGIQEMALPYDIKAIFRERADYTEEFRNLYRERLDEVKIYDPENMTPVYLHYFLKFEIKDVYPGSSWDDTCISDFMPGSMVSDPVSRNEMITKIYQSKGNDYILFDTDIRTKMVLVDMKDLMEYKQLTTGVKMALALMDASQDMEWAQVDFMFSAPGARVEEYPVLYHIRSGSRIGEDLLGKTTAMYGFSENDGRLWLETDIGPLDLEKIKKNLEEKK